MTLTPTAPDPRTWWQRAACRSADPDLFFPVGADDSPATARQVTEAKQVCAACPVRLRCLLWAMDTRTDYGVWGATTGAERRALRRREMRRAAALTRTAREEPAA